MANFGAEFQTQQIHIDKWPKYNLSTLKPHSIYSMQNTV